MANREELLTPTGRLVQGSLYVPNTKDAEGKILVFKTGDKIGQPRTDFYIAIAVKKTNETHWSQTEWGKKIWAAGHKGFPNGQADSPSFAWKIIDGDSTIPNRRGTIPANCDGFAGCWILKFNGSQAPTLLTLDSNNKTKSLLEKDAIKPGDFIQIQGNVSDNESLQQPGVFLNHNMICFRGHGERIILGVDPDSVGFGNDQLPQGASLQPVGNFTTPSVAIPLPVPIANIAAPAPVTPYPEIRMPPVPAPVQSKVMGPAAQGTYEQYVTMGWTDAQLIQQGLMSIQ